MMLGALSGGRVGITSGTLVHMRLALTIAIRYSATRLQFKSTGADFELPIWEYPSQRYRLLPRLSELFAISVFSRWLLTEHAENKKMMSNKIPSTQSLKTIAEIHAISSASKPYASWVSRDAIQECREACGGHGYASINRLGMLRDDNDPNVTYEGENKVLIQQTSRFLLKCVQAVEANMPGENLKKLQEISPLGSVLFLANYLTILQSSFRGNSSQELRRIHVLLEAFEWRVVFLLKETAEKFQIEVTRSKNEFDAWNNSQVFHCQPLGLAFIEALILRKNIEFLESRAIEHEQTAEVFRRLLVLFALYRINLDMGVFRQRDFISASQSKLIQDEILQLLCELKTETIAIVDAIAAPDSILQAPIGLSNGQPYINYWNHLISNEDTVARPHFHSLLSQQVFPASRL